MFPKFFQCNFSFLPSLNLLLFLEVRKKIYLKKISQNFMREKTIWGWEENGFA
jgi:hypothetical protein